MPSSLSSIQTRPSMWKPFAIIAPASTSVRLAVVSFVPKFTAPLVPVKTVPEQLIVSIVLFSVVLSDLDSVKEYPLGNVKRTL